MSFGMSIYNLLYLVFLQIHGSQISSKYIDNSKMTIFDFALDDTVTITEAFYPNFNFLAFLSDTGGAIGLWLGLGMVQLVQYVVTGARILKGRN